MADIRRAIRLANLMYQSSSIQYTTRERITIREQYRALKEEMKNEHQCNQNRQGLQHEGVRPR